MYYKEIEEFKDLGIWELMEWGICGLGNYKKSKELPCWQKTRELCQAVSKLINKAKFQKDTILSGQIWNAAGSAMDNIAEWFDDGSSREFIRFSGYSQVSYWEV